MIASCADPGGGQSMIMVETIAVEVIAVEMIAVEAIAVETIIVEVIAVETIAVEVIASCADPGGSINNPEYVLMVAQ